MKTSCLPGTRATRPPVPGPGSARERLDPAQHLIEAAQDAARADPEPTVGEDGQAVERGRSEVSAADLGVGGSVEVANVMRPDRRPGGDPRRRRWRAR